jgi:hypothetical protein
MLNDNGQHGWRVVASRSLIQVRHVSSCHHPHTAHADFDADRRLAVD